MSTRGGSSCAVATCISYSGKIKKDGRTDVSFHRYLLIILLYYIILSIKFTNFIC